MGLALYGGGQRQCLFVVQCILIFLSKRTNWMSAIWKNSKVYKYKESEFCHFGIVLLGEVKWQLTEGVMLFLQTWVNN